MTPTQEMMLRQRLVEGSADERRLNEILVAIGGDIWSSLLPGWGLVQNFSSSGFYGYWSSVS
jgi:hypothetical protein